MTPRRVLVVTDIDLAGWALRHALTAAGFVVISAGDIEAARTVIEVSDPFDVVVVSLSLGVPQVSTFLEHARCLWPGVPAILLAVAPEPQPVTTRPEDMVLEKPYSIEEVAALALRTAGDPRSDASLAGIDSAPRLAHDHERDA